MLTDLFSADSHVIEASELWEGILPAMFWPGGSAGFELRPGAREGSTRADAMAQDGVVGEILYPTLGLRVFGLDDGDLQRRACRRYNEWIIDFCAAAPDRLFGIGMIPAYAPDDAVAEVEFCAAHGLRGCMVWQTPDPAIPFSSGHYDPFWAATEALGLPVSLHILTGHNHTRDYGTVAGSAPPAEFGAALKRPTLLKPLVAATSLFDIVFSGVFDRFPNARVVIVENEVSWLPFVVDQWDYYLDRYDDQELHGTAGRPPLRGRPSSYVRDNVFLTFFRDPVAARLLEWWGADNCMWSNDYPHGNTTWPNSRTVVRDTFGHLSAETLDKVLRRNARNLYGLPSGETQP
jgi:predicted TIM-barrel fold metal-dependent hydrolase